MIVAVCLSLIGAGLIWPMLRRVDAAQPPTALAAFKSNATIGLFVTLAYALEPAWRTLHLHLGGV
jgi:hypothetical protein